MAITQLSSGPARTIRPGDLLGSEGVGSFIDNAERMNAVGYLVACCDVTAPVIIGWSVRYFYERMMSPLLPSHHSAVVFGPQQAVRERFIDIHREIGQAIVSVRSRTITFDRGSILFAYLEDGNDLIGHHFNSVWIVGDGPSQAEVQRQLEYELTRLARAAQRDREQRRAQIAQSSQSLDVRTASVRQPITASGMVVGFDSAVEATDETTMTISVQPVDANGQNVGSPILQQVQVVSGPAGEFRIEAHATKPEEPIRFPEKRLFLKEEEE